MPPTNIFLSFLLLTVALLSLKPRLISAEDATCTNRDDRGFCRDAPRKCPSQTDLALEMARLSSPKAIAKLRRILSTNPGFEVDLGGIENVFDTVAYNLRTALEGYGLKPVPNSHSSTNNPTLRLETFFSGYENPTDLDAKSVFFLQTEQIICCSHYGELELPYLQRCHSASNCLIWEFLQANGEFLNQHGLTDSVLLVPFLLQQKLDQYYPTTLNIPQLQERPIDVVFFGVQTNRRNQIQKELQNLVQQNQLNWNILFQEVPNYGSQLQYMASHYIQSKICLIVHAYGDKAAGEYHRLSELATSGCLPIVESFQDTIGIDAYSNCGGVIFADLANIPGAIHNTLNSIAQGDTFKFYQRLLWWRQRVQWGQLLNLILEDDVVER